MEGIYEKESSINKWGMHDFAKKHNYWELNNLKTSIRDYEKSIISIPIIKWSDLLNTPVKLEYDFSTNVTQYTSQLLEFTMPDSAGLNSNGVDLFASNNHEDHYKNLLLPTYFPQDFFSKEDPRKQKIADLLKRYAFGKDKLCLLKAYSLWKEIKRERIKQFYLSIRELQRRILKVIKKITDNFKLNLRTHFRMIVHCLFKNLDDEARENYLLLDAVMSKSNNSFLNKLTNGKAKSNR